MSETVKRTRLDRLLVERGHYASRSRAGDAVRRGAVAVNGKQVTKPGASVAGDVEVAIADDVKGYVSRAAGKLIHALDHFAFDVSGTIALDLGASTGGFTQVLLERGAARVWAIDVGHDQMAAVVRRDRRVRLIEGCNARDLTAAVIDEAIDLIVCDVSFISLKAALPAALSLTAAEARLVALIKPQFEAGREHVASGGIVRDGAVRQRVCDDIATWLGDQCGWRVVGLTPSPVTGSDGNREFLIAARKP